MTDIIIHPLNATYNRIETEPSIEQELWEHFTFKVPNYEFMKAKNPVKLKHWSGDIRLFNKRNKRIYVGLTTKIEEFARDRGYTVHINNSGDTEFSGLEAVNFIKSLNLPKDRMPREYQFKAFLRAIRKSRILVLSPTASGKSLLLYLIIRYYLLDSEYSGSCPHMYKCGCGTQSGPHSCEWIRPKILLIVPTINLIHQMASDFKEYGWDIEKYIHLIYEGQPKEASKPVWISTWQSIYGMPPEYFLQFKTIICDEVHHAQAESIKSILENSINAHTRVGCTGTLHDTPVHHLTLEGLFGEVYEATTTKELIEQKHLAELKIKCIVLKHQKSPKFMEYAEEIEYLALHEARNRFIKNLTLSLKGNTLILFKLVDKHGKILYEQLKCGTFESGRKVHYISGEVDGKEREDIRHLLAEESNSILVGSYGTVSTGINIPSLHNIIFASPYKSRIKVLQSIGRGLRNNTAKQTCTVFDIADDLTKGRSNITLNHFEERLKLYYEEEFEPQIYRVNLK